LDSSAYTKGATDADAAQQKMREGADKSGKEFEAAGRKGADAFGQITRSVVLLFAAFTGGRGIKEFISDITTSDAAIGRMAIALGTTTEKLSEWQGVAQSTGGTSAGITSSLANLENQLQNFALTGESSTIQYFRALRISLQQADGQFKTSSDLLTDLANNPTLHNRDPSVYMPPERANAILRSLGIDQTTASMIMKDGEALAAYRKEVDAAGLVTKEQSTAAGLLEEKWAILGLATTTLGRIIVTSLTPGMVKLLDEFTHWIEINRTWLAQDIEDAIKNIGVAVHDLSVGFTKVKDSLDSVGISGKAVLEFFTVVFAIRMAAAFGPLGLALAAILFTLEEIGRLSSKGAMGGPENYPINSPLWSSIPDKEQGNYVNSPRSQEFLHPNGENPYPFSWAEPWTWLHSGPQPAPPVPPRPGPQAVPHPELPNPPLSGPGRMPAPPASAPAARPFSAPPAPAPAPARPDLAGTPFAQLLARGESGAAGYNSVNRGAAGGYKSGTENLGQKTVGQVMADQAAQKYNAAGKYQIIGPTLDLAVHAMNIPLDAKFDKALQDRIFSQYLASEKRPALGAYLNRQSDDVVAAMRDASKEWASVTDPDKGRSHYPGQKASITADEMALALAASRVPANAGALPAVAAAPTPMPLGFWTSMADAFQAGAAQLLAAPVAPSSDLSAAVAAALQRAPAPSPGLAIGAPAAAAASNVANDNRSTTHTSTSESHVGSINVYTTSSDGAGIAKDIKPALERNTFANNANYGLA
jgi:hypothetical protein